MKRYLIFAYSLVCYAIFLGTFLYAIWFVWTMDAMRPAPGVSLGKCLFVDAVLLTLFALQHSIMARLWFKRAWTRIVPVAAERSTYVLCASLALLLLFHYWQPLPGTVWKVENRIGVMLLEGLAVLGWLTVLISTFVIDHFELFGLKQAWCNLTGAEFRSGGFATPGPYKFVRHPLYLGFIIAFWSAPIMTSGHLFFAVMTTAYVLVAIPLEERDLTAILGEQYRGYQKSVSMLTPFPRK
jgi:protein-S-isoprenylcysteine O-methyltransferase Ste14